METIPTEQIGQQDSLSNTEIQEAAEGKENVALFYRAFSEKIRLRILSLLLQGEMCVGDMVTILLSPQSTISRHLHYLRKAGLVTTRQTRYWVHYFLVKPQTSFHTKLLETVLGCSELVPEIQQDAQRARELQDSGGCCPGAETAMSASKDESAM